MQVVWTGVFRGYRGDALQDPGYELRRKSIPRTPVNKGKRRDRSPALEPRPSSPPATATHYWPIQAHGLFDVVIKASMSAHERPGTTSIRATSSRATTNTTPASTFTAMLFIALHRPSVSPSSGHLLLRAAAGCTTGSLRPLGAQLRRGMVLRLCRLY
jgi:hypothetical protein